MKMFYNNLMDLSITTNSRRNDDSKSRSHYGTDRKEEKLDSEIFLYQVAILRK